MSTIAKDTRSSALESALAGIKVKTPRTLVIALCASVAISAGLICYQTIAMYRPITAYQAIVIDALVETAAQHTGDEADRIRSRLRILIDIPSVSSMNQLQYCAAVRMLAAEIAH